MKLSDKGQKTKVYLETTDMGDAEIARLVELSRERVRQLRKKLEIPSKGKVKPKAVKRNYPPDVHQVLGKFTDPEAATYYGKDRFTIFRWRKALNIPAKKVIKELVIPSDFKWKLLRGPYHNGKYRVIFAECTCGHQAEVLVASIRRGVSKGCGNCAQKHRRK